MWPLEADGFGYRAPVLILSICETWGKSMAIMSLVFLLWTMEAADGFSICRSKFVTELG